MSEEMQIQLDLLVAMSGESLQPNTFLKGLEADLEDAQQD